jgi:hypothetical protein
MSTQGQAPAPLQEDSKSAHQIAVDQFHTVTEQRKTGWFVTVDGDRYRADGYHSFYEKTLAYRIARDVKGFADKSSSGGIKDVVTSLKGYEAP